MTEIKIEQVEYTDDGGVILHLQGGVDVELTRAHIMEIAANALAPHELREVLAIMEDDE